MRVCEKNNAEEPKEIYDYIGCWYPRQFHAQALFLRLKGIAEKAEFDTEPVGGGYSGDEWHDIDLRIYFVENVISEKEADSFLFQNNEIIRDLFNMFYTKWDGNNYIGYWNNNLWKKLKQNAEEFESNYEWREEQENEMF